jgi:AraC family ethanolamine operon transcriptional activator
MDAKAIKPICQKAGTMLQRGPVDRYRNPATLPNGPRMAKQRCLDQPGIDIDEIVSRFQGFNLELLQIDQGTFRAEGMQARLGDVLLGTARFGRALVQTWKSPAQLIAIAVATSRASALWRGTSFGHSDLLVAGPEAEIELVSMPGFGVTVASFPVHRFQRAAELCGRGSLVDGARCTVVRLPKAHAARELGTATRTLILDVLANPSDARDPEWEQAKGDDLLHRMVLTVSGGVPVAQSKHNAERAQLLEQAVSAIRERPADVLTVTDLCGITGASERTLNYAFVERYGLPPARFMKACRLNGARKDLGRIDTREFKISDVANKWGFWHLGQFAKDYRLWFGELPSETFRRNHADN